MPSSELDELDEDSDSEEPLELDDKLVLLWDELEELPDELDDSLSAGGA